MYVYGFVYKNFFSIKLIVFSNYVMYNVCEISECCLDCLLSGIQAFQVGKINQDLRSMKYLRILAYPSRHK